jgi:hypothetical protein
MSRETTSDCVQGIGLVMNLLAIAAGFLILLER